LDALKAQIADHDDRLAALFAALGNLLEEKREEKSWEERERIGFKMLECRQS